MKWPSARVAQCSPKSFGMYSRARSLGLERDLIHLEIGRPDFDTPQHVKEATQRALDDGVVHYGEFAGELRLRQSLAAKLRSYNRLEVTADQILITNGLTHAAYAAFTAALDPGDEVLLLEPYYPQHVNKIELAGGRVVMARLDGRRGFRIERAPIESRITDRTRMICLVNPCNPTGRVYQLDELRIIADLAIKYDLLVASDEVYDQLVFDPHQHISIASLPGMRDRTISMFAFTKTYAMDGWRLGYLTCSSELIPALLMITMNDVTHVNVFIQHGAHAAITGPGESLLHMRTEIDKRRRLVCERLNAIEGIVCPLPQGTIYAFPDVSAFGIPSRQIAEKLLEETGVVVENGSFYGPAGEGYLRVCFASEPYAVLEEAMDRIARWFRPQALDDRDVTRSHVS